MNDDTRARLCAINRNFYDRVAQEFGATRDHPWPGWTPLLEELAPEPLSVLDVGCGNGRFATFLAEARPAPLDSLGPLQYLGLDSSERLLAQARARNLGDCARFERRDLLPRPPRNDVAAGLPAGPYDLISVFGFLHHVPAFEARCTLLLDLGARLAAGGLLAVSVWRFGDSERLHGRAMSWEHYNETASAKIDLAQLEPGDRLLRWGDRMPSAGGPACVRYCHLADEAEVESLLAAVRPGASGLQLASRYRADGRSGDLNQYLLLRRSDG